jgi:hypothetical protein
MINHLYNAGLTTDGIIFLCMLAVVGLAWVGNEWGS